MKQTTLTLTDMPFRTEKLALSDVEKIFGGCGQNGAKCGKDSDCCWGLKCKSVQIGATITIKTTPDDNPQYAMVCTG